MVTLHNSSSLLRAVPARVIFSERHLSLQSEKLRCCALRAGTTKAQQWCIGQLQVWQRVDVEVVFAT